ncbi:MAG: DNA gyrase/topoisomerase IV subunit A, partial [Sediminibacterium sp.]|nr:DNA gyrase/topoisomerase IV subunit A [Sediminibacterium sp.]
ELIQRFEGQEIILIEKFDIDKIYSVVYLDNEKYQVNVKRFKIETTTIRTQYSCIKEGEDNVLLAVSSSSNPILNIQLGKGLQIRSSKIKLDKLVDVMGWKAIGTKLVEYNKTLQLAWEEPKLNRDEAENLFNQK